MSTIPPSLPPSGPQPSPAPAAGMVTVISDPRALLAHLAAGAIVEATTTAPSSSAKTIVTVQSTDGSLQIKLPAAVPAGATLQLQIGESGDLSQLRLLSVNGQPVPPPGQSVATTSATVPPATVATGTADQSQATEKTSATIADPVAPSPTKGITATVVSTQTGPAGPASAAALPTGTVFTVRIAGIQNAAMTPSDPGVLSQPDGTSTAVNVTDSTFTNARLARQAYGQSWQQAAAPSSPPPEAMPPPIGQEPPASGAATQPPPSPAPASVPSAPSDLPHTASPPATPPAATIPPSSVPAETPLSPPDQAEPAPPFPSPATMAAPANAVATPSATTPAANMPAPGPAAVNAPIAVANQAPPQPGGAPPVTPVVAASPSMVSAPPSATFPSIPQPAAATSDQAAASAATAPPVPTASEEQASSPPPVAVSTAASESPESSAADVLADGSALDDPLSAPPTAAAAALPQSFTGVVAPNNQGGLPLLQTPLGLLSLETATDLPSGAIVTLEPLDAPTLPTLDGETTGAGPLPGISFTEAIAVLRQIEMPNPATAPDSSSRLVATLIGLTASVESASVRPWLGDRLVKTLEKAGHRDLIERMEKDLAALKSPVRMPLGGEWQSLILPLPVGHRIEPIRLIVRRPPGDEAEAEAREEEGTRFLVDVDMSRLGAIQIDGLLRRKSKRFDMILRSHAVLPDGIRHDIAAIFDRSLEGLGMAGTAHFQQTTAFIEPVPVTEAENSGWVI